MPRDGSGVFTLNAGYSAVTGQPILPSNHNPPLEDLAAAMTESIARSGVTPLTGDIPFGGFKATGLGDASDAGDALSLGFADARYDSRYVQDNFGFSAVAAANALTITLTSSDGTALTADNAAFIPFRSAAATNAAIVTRSVTAPLTLVLSSGSTLGVPAISTAFSLFVVAFDDGGTVRLGVINRLSGSTCLPLLPRDIGSATAEGGAGAADVAQIFYSSAAVSAKAYTVLGRLTWSSGVLTLGTWVDPTRIDMADEDAPWFGATSIGTSVLLATTATNARAAIAAPLIPTNGGGGFFGFSTAPGGTVTLPGGGTWAYYIFGYSNSTNLIAGAGTGGVAAGGTTVASASGDVIWTGFWWRVT